MPNAAARLARSRASADLSRRDYNRTVTRRLSVALIHFRKLAGLSQHNLAEVSGVSRSTINALESGQSGDVFVRTVWLLAAALGISPGELLTWGAGMDERIPLKVSGSKGASGELVLGYEPEG